MLGLIFIPLPPLIFSQGSGCLRLDEVIAQSLARLQEAQFNKGGFGWWPGAHEPDLWMTGYVVWGLSQAQKAGIDVPEHLLERATLTLIEAIGPFGHDTDTTAWALAATSQSKYLPKNIDSKALPSIFERLYAKRDDLSASGRACLVLAAKQLNRSAELSVLIRNLENGAVRVQTPDLGDTVHWGSTSGYWHAMDGAVESTALTLLSLLETDQKNPLVEPAINWLLLNRRSAHWTNTRDTAFALLALARGLELRGDAQPDAEVELVVNGTPLQRVKLTRESLLHGVAAVTVDTAKLKPGQTTFTMRRIGGKTPVYAIAHSTAWARGDSVHPMGHLIKIDRALIRQKTQETLMGTLRITPEAMTTGSKATTGEQITAAMTLNVPNELEYVIVEVPKPAGCEPLNPLSGWDARIMRIDEAKPVEGENTAEKENLGNLVYREEHDDKSVFFLDHLSAGKWQLRFGLRAVTSGNFRVLPAQAQAMYVPEVCANSDALRVKIEHAK